MLRKLDSRRALVRRLASVFVLGAVLVVALPAQAQEPLSFFKNYFTTGDYTVRGVSLWRKGVDGTAVAYIPPLGKLGGPGGVSDHADILAAFLYVQTAESVQGSGIDHATFFGSDLGPFIAAGSTEPGSGTFAKPLVAWENAPKPCWSVAVPLGRKVMTYRVDILRFLPIDPDTGKLDLKKKFKVTVPDAGGIFGDDDENCRETRPSNLPRAIGASLLVVYRDPTKPFSAIVIYDGAYKKPGLAKMVQPITGFYQSSTDMKPAAKMSHIVGSGRLLLSEQVLLGTQLVAKNPYVGGDGLRWDDTTFANLPLPGNADSTTVTVDRQGLLSDCLTFSAMVFRTTVQDTDGDGLIDRWETSPPPLSPLRDSAGNRIPLPDIGAMGASPLHQDVFVQVGYMFAAEGTMYGGTPRPKHTHLPGQDALTMAAESFDQAPVANPDGTTGIKVHFDVGDNYQGLPFVIPTILARGGQGISETRACEDPANPVTGKPIECATFDAGGNVVTQGDLPGQYPKYPGTVGWKTGFQLIRDELLGFDSTRKDIFHYVLFAHSLGMPKEPCQTTDAAGNLISDFTCQATNTDFHVPRTNSGIADYPGGDLMVTLGAFDDDQQLPIGTQFMQGATLMHELGHNYELTHSGLGSLDPAVKREPNCKPNYLSVMNYLYQLRGLPDSKGILRMDYSADVVDGVNESILADGFLTPLGAPRYRAGWYAPFDTSYLKGFGKAATKHCDGSDLLKDVNGKLLEIPMVRVDAASLDTAIDWNADGALDAAGVASSGLQDINFDGIFETINPGSDDWANLRLNQLGGRRNVGGYYVDLQGRIAVGPLSLDIGRGDIGRGDIGRGDIGRGDIGRGDIGRGDIGIAIGRGDIGRGDIGRGDIGRGDIGRGDIGRGDIGRGAFGGGDLDVGGANEPIGDLDLATAVAVSGNNPNSPPSSPATQLTACRTVLSGEFSYNCVVEGGNTPIRLDWLAPHLGQALSYSIYRFVVDPEAVFPPAALPTTRLAIVFGGDGLPPDTTYLDFSAPAGVELAYFIIANFAGEVSSGISNFARVTTPLVTSTVTITGTTPGTAAAGYGQMITVFTQGAPAGTPTAIFTQGQWGGQGFVFQSPSQQNAYYVRLPFNADGMGNTSAPSPGPAAVRLVFGPNTLTGNFPLTVSSTPGTPQARSVYGMTSAVGGDPCATGFALSSTTPISDIVPGQGIAISAYGLDTSGAQAVFTQGELSITVASNCSLSRSDYGLAAVFAVPALVAGSVTVELTTRVNGVTSARSGPVLLTVGEPPSITSVTPDTIINPVLHGTSTTGSFVISGTNLQGGEIYTDGWVLLTGTSQVNADGTQITRGYIEGHCTNAPAQPCTPAQGNLNLFVATPFGVSNMVHVNIVVQ